VTIAVGAPWARRSRSERGSAARAGREPRSRARAARRQRARARVTATTCEHARPRRRREAKVRACARHLFVGGANVETRAPTRVGRRRLRRAGAEAGRAAPPAGRARPRRSDPGRRARRLGRQPPSWRRINWWAAAAPGRARSRAPRAARGAPRVTGEASAPAGAVERRALLAVALAQRVRRDQRLDLADTCRPPSSSSARSAPRRETTQHPRGDVPRAAQRLVRDVGQRRARHSSRAGADRRASSSSARARHGEPARNRRIELPAPMRTRSRAAPVTSASPRTAAAAKCVCREVLAVSARRRPTLVDEALGRNAWSPARAGPKSAPLACRELERPATALPRGSEVRNSASDTLKHWAGRPKASVSPRCVGVSERFGPAGRSAHVYPHIRADPLRTAVHIMSSSSRRGHLRGDRSPRLHRLVGPERQVSPATATSIARQTAARR